MNADHKLFLSARINKTSEEIEVTVETYICLFVYTYCDLTTEVYFVDDSDDYHCTISKQCLENLQYECLTKEQIQYQELCLHLPAIQADEGKGRIAGVCAILRWVIKSQLSKFPHHYSKALLGFRGGCLVACTESSVWTKFCELQLPSTVEEVSCLKKTGEKITAVPPNLVLLEAHLRRPVRTHNILKRKLDIAKKARQSNSTTVSNDLPKHSSHISGMEVNFSILDNNSMPLTGDDVSKALQSLVITEQSQDFSLEHNYLEGIDLTLADMIVFPCVHYLLRNIPLASLLHLETVVQWYERMSSNELVARAAKICDFQLNNGGFCLEDLNPQSITVPAVDKDSLYKRDPSHSKMKCKHRNPSDILLVLQNASIHPKFSNNYCSTLEWQNLPLALHPATGDLPQKRIDRKCQQIESMVTATLKIAADGQTVVEFCAGGGHVGLLLAYFLPKCKIILIENKESSILRAKSRAEALNLKNISFYQCNLDYFKGSFDVGVALHACGVATDLVIQQCIKEKASFVCCPCCYGGIQNTHLLSYPLSERFCSTSLPYEKYTLLAHCADRTEINTPSAAQGELCMSLIDTDRIFWGKEHGYDVELTTLNPISCSPKHNLLIGRSPKCKKIIEL